MMKVAVLTVSLFTGNMDEMCDGNREICVLQQNWGSYLVFVFADSNLSYSILLSKQHNRKQMVKGGGTAYRYIIF